MKAFKLFEVRQRSVKIQIYFNFLYSSGIAGERVTHIPYELCSAPVSRLDVFWNRLISILDQNPTPT